jgi:hypothetical protein
VQDKITMVKCTGNWAENFWSISLGSTQFYDCFKPQAASFKRRGSCKMSGFMGLVIVLELKTHYICLIDWEKDVFP